MNLKKIWIYAIIFGLLTSGLLYIIVSPDQKANVQNNSNTNTTSQLENNIAENNNEQNVLDQPFDIAKGKRAVTVAVNNIQSVSNFVTPGSFVDVITVQPSPQGGSSQILLENIKVLAAGQTTTITDDTANDENEDSTNEEAVENKVPLAYQMVTLEVSPAEGAALALATDTGFISLMLRGTGDKGNSPGVRITLEQITKGEVAK
jgi:pilus assembly protein CpaB